jgi:hypothetical protein
MRPRPFLNQVKIGRCRATHHPHAGRHCVHTRRPDDIPLSYRALADTRKSPVQISSCA